MSVTHYTTYASVRAVLGVDDIELPDETLALPYLSYGLDRALASVTGTLAPDTEARTLAGHHDYIESLAGSATEAQDLFLGLIKSYATYLVAAEVGGSLSMFAPKTKSDGKALATRFSSEATFRDTMQALYNNLNGLRSSIYETLGISVGNFPYVNIVSPETDLVTNS